MRRESRNWAANMRRTLLGARLAAISVAAGAVATIASVSAVAVVATMGNSPPRGEHGARLASHPSTVLPAADSPSLATALGQPAGPVREQQLGQIVLVDVGAEVPSLDDELDHQRRLAAAHRQRWVVWLVVDECKPCDAVSAALASPEVQSAVGPLRVVRLDAVDFLVELTRLGLSLDAFPAFVLVGPDGRAVDYVHGGEWDEDVPENIAPVLKSFVEGTYTSRRSPWQGGLHDDETPI